MKRIIGIFISIMLLISSIMSVMADNTINKKYYTINVEFSDNRSEIEHLNVMIKDNHVYVNAEELAGRLGYNINVTDIGVSISNATKNNLPYRITQFFYNDTRVNHMLFSRMLKNYEAPYPSIKDERGAWIPMEYSLLLLNSSMMIINDTVLIDIPEKDIMDIFRDIMKTNYSFEWETDFGYTPSDVTWIRRYSHVANLLNGALGGDWKQLFQSFIANSDSYDEKFGENLAMLLCTESDKELEESIEQVEKYYNIFNEDGELGELLSKYSAKLNTDVEAMHGACEDILENIKKGNSSLGVYNRACKAFEDALDKQTWFSKTGENIIQIQKGISDAIPYVDTLLKIAKVVGYAKEFTNQDEFSVQALSCFLDNSFNQNLMSEAMKRSMIHYSNELKGNVVKYSLNKAFKDEVNNWIELGLEIGAGVQANIIKLTWNLMSNLVPFLSEKIEAAQQFELALYSFIFQGDAYQNYQSYRDQIFEDEINLTAENLYKLSQYCYIYLKSCYITRDAAIGSLNGKRDSIKEQIQPLIDAQNNINKDIAKMLIKLKGAKNENEGMIYGFLPSDNEHYLLNYDDTQLIKLCNESVGKSGSYDEIIDEYRKAELSQYYNGDTSKMPNVNPEVYLSGYSDAKLYYTMQDLNSDGMNELIIASLSDKYENGYEIYDMYQYKNGMIQRLCEEHIGYRIRYRLCENNIIRKTLSGGVYNISYQFYKMANDGSSLYIVDQVQYEGTNGDSYYHGELFDPASKISRQEYEQIIAQYVLLNNIEWKEISSKQVKTQSTETEKSPQSVDEEKVNQITELILKNEVNWWNDGCTGIVGVHDINLDHQVEWMVEQRGGSSRNSGFNYYNASSQQFSYLCELSADSWELYLSPEKTCYFIKKVTPQTAGWVTTQYIERAVLNGTVQDGIVLFQKDEIDWALEKYQPQIFEGRIRNSDKLIICKNSEQEISEEEMQLGIDNYKAFMVNSTNEVRILSVNWNPNSSIEEKRMVIKNLLLDAYYLNVEP